MKLKRGDIIQFTKPYDIVYQHDGVGLIGIVTEVSGTKKEYVTLGIVTYNPGFPHYFKFDYKRRGAVVLTHAEGVDDET